jgi:hypothetical protein
MHVSLEMARTLIGVSMRPIRKPHALLRSVNLAHHKMDWMGLRHINNEPVYQDVVRRILADNHILKVNCIIEE